MATEPEQQEQPTADELDQQVEELGQLIKDHLERLGHRDPR